MDDAPENALARPARMYGPAGQPVVDVFAGSERLFRRFTPKEADETEFKRSFRFYPDMSVNREGPDGLWSEPQDVLYEARDGVPAFYTQGVFFFRVEQLPPPQSEGGDVVYSWRPTHEPLSDNYAHSEVRTYKGDQFIGPKGSINSPVLKARIRAIFFQHFLEQKIFGLGEAAHLIGV